MSKIGRMEALILACKRDGLLDAEAADAAENFERGAPT